jgi:hypothetical protein
MSRASSTSTPALASRVLQFFRVSAAETSSASAAQGDSLVSPSS